jgi:uncharacterized membrane protein
VSDPSLTDARWERALRVGVVVVLVAGVVLRFVTRSPLWLDEALSANIAGLPLGEIPAALRRDGHPPLYYVLLHGWMEAAGTSDGAVRALSGLWGVALLPLLWVAGRRLGGVRVAWYALGVAALSPYALRYATETRMYAMVMVLSLVGWLLLDDAVRRPSPLRLAALACTVALMLWTHYWAIWLLVVVGVSVVVLAVRARRAGDQERFRRLRNVIAALVVGGLAFVPWLPSLLSQGANTGTPWARPLRPNEMFTNTVADLGGGPQSEAVLLGWSLVFLVILGVTGRATGRLRVELDLRTRPEARPLAIAVSATLAVGCVAGYLLGTAYASRYAAVFVPFVVLLAALGLSRLDVRVASVVLAMLVVLGLIGAYRNVTVERSDGRRNAETIEAEGTDGDVVFFCPDQLGPSTARELDERFDALTFPRFEDPDLVDWVDYTERLEDVEVEEVAADLLERAGDRTIYVVYSTSYITHEESCGELITALWAQRPREDLEEPTEAFEPSALVRFRAPD